MAMYTIGGIFGALSTTFLGDRLGRRKMIFWASAFVIVGAILMASSFEMGQMIVARFLVGLGTGATTATVPVWQSELSKANNRGSHVVTEGMFIGVGVTISLWIDLGFYYLDPSSAAWRTPLALEIPWAIIVMLFVFTMPESPRWLIKMDRVEEAREIMSILEDLPIDSEQIANDIADIQASLALAGSVSKRDLLKMGEQRIFHRMVLAAGVQFFSQICGINSITFYASTIFQQDMGLDGTKSRILGAAMETIQPIGGLTGVFTIDRFGRRPLMLISATAMSICMCHLCRSNIQPSEPARAYRGDRLPLRLQLLLPDRVSGSHLPLLHRSCSPPPPRRHQRLLQRHDLALQLRAGRDHARRLRQPQEPLLRHLGRH